MKQLESAEAATVTSRPRLETAVTRTEAQRNAGLSNQGENWHDPYIDKIIAAALSLTGSSSAVR